MSQICFTVTVLVLLQFAGVVSRVDNSGSGVAGGPQVALPPPGTSTIRLRIINVSTSIMV